MKLRNYEFVFSGCDVNDKRFSNETRIVKDYDLESAKLRLVRDFVYIRVMFGALAL